VTVFVPNVSKLPEHFCKISNFHQVEEAVAKKNTQLSSQNRSSWKRKSGL